MCYDAILNLDLTHLNICSGVKKSLVLVSWDKLNFREDKHIFSPNVRRTSTNFYASLFKQIDKDKLFSNRTSQNFDVLARGTSEIF